MPVDRGHPVAERQCGELFAPDAEERLGAEQECASSQLDHGREGRVDVVVGAGSQDMQLQPESTRRVSSSLADSTAYYALC
jgi:mitochondrial fission protein ELM1